MRPPSTPPSGPLLIDTVSGLAYRLLQTQPAAPRRLLVLLHGIGCDDRFHHRDSITSAVWR